MKNIPLLLLTLIAISSCLDSSREIAKRVEVYFYVDDIGEDLVFGTDTVQVSEFKFALSGFKLINTDGVELGTADAVTALIYSYDTNALDSRLVVSTGLGYDLNNFEEYVISLAPVDDSDRIQDDDFFGAPNNYSIIIKGDINGSLFTFESSSSFEKSYTFEPIKLSDTEETLFIRNLISMEDVLTDSSGMLINPTDSESGAEIVSNIHSNLEVQISSGTFFR